MMSVSEKTPVEFDAPSLSSSMRQINIAVLDDDAAMLGVVDRVVRMQGYGCQLFSRVEKFLEALNSTHFDLVVIDWVMPQASGLDVVNVMRNELGLTCPIMMISSRHLEEDVVFALYSGIDDYATKPLRPMEFLARMTKLLRRGATASEGRRHDFDPYAFDEGARTVSLNGSVVHISPKEFDLALYLFRNMNLRLERQKILSSVFGRSHAQTSRTLDTHAYQVRKALELDGRHGFKLATVYGVGYQLLRVGSATNGGSHALA
jgi:two-component system, OmpR family, phosphate regulon response regulator PhoB